MIPEFSSIPPDGGIGASPIQDLTGQIPPSSFLPQPGTIIPLPYSRSSSKHLKEAKEQIIGNLKRSAEYISNKVALWELFEDLYFGNRALNQWKLNREQAQSRNVYKNLTKDFSLNDPTSWRSQQCISPAPFVDQYVQVITKAAFANELFYRITPSAAFAAETVEDPEFPTSRKMQALLLNSLDELQFRSRTNEGLRDACIFGTMAGKTPWHEDAEYEQVLEIDDLYQIHEREQKTIIRQGVALDLLNLAKFLPDPDAKHGDVQRWEFVGNREQVPYHTIRSRFAQGNRRGPYNTGYREFLHQWPDGGQPLGSNSETEIKQDSDAYSIPSVSPVTYLQVWEYHGRIYFSDRSHPIECVGTLVTDLNTNDPFGGILVRFQEQPAIKVGCRPYGVYQCIPQAAPLGIGLIEQNLDLIWLLSHAVNLFIDAVRLISLPMFKYRKGGPWSIEMDAATKGELLYPGKGIPYSIDPNEVEPFSLQVIDLRALIELIQYLEKMLEKRTTVSDASRGLSQNRKTATEVASLMQASQQPLETALGLFKETFLDPFGRIALTQFQQKIREDQTIWMRDSAGQPSPQLLTLQEIQTGSYRVEATVDMPEHAKISKAQTILQILPIAEQFRMSMLLLENKHIKMAGLFEGLLRCVDITEETNCIEDVDEQTKQMLLMMMQGGIPPQGQPQGQSVEGQPIEPNPEMAQGSLPPDLQELVARIQFDAQAQGPVPVGRQAA